jgi:septum formation protein
MPPSLWLAQDPLVLASRSKARQMLLAAAGVPVETCPADLDERGLEAKADLQTAGAVAVLLAREKAIAAAKLRPGRLTLGADQMLALGAERFAKPADRPAARARLRALRGRSHELHSAIVFVQDGKVLYEYVGVARMMMRAFSDEFLESYLDAIGQDVTTIVGVYQIEGLGMQLFDRIEGDYFTVLGLPLMEALAFLRHRGCLVR